MSNFSFSHSVLKRLVMQTRKNEGLFGKGLMTLRKRVFQNTVGKGENAGNLFFFSHNIFHHTKNKFHVLGYTLYLKLKSADTFNLEKSKICLLVES